MAAIVPHSDLSPSTANYLPKERRPKVDERQRGHDRACDATSFSQGWYAICRLVSEPPQSCGLPRSRSLGTAATASATAAATTTAYDAYFEYHRIPRADTKQWWNAWQLQHAS